METTTPKKNIVSRTAVNKKYYLKTREKRKEQYKNSEKIYCKHCKRYYTKGYIKKHNNTLTHNLNSRYMFIDDDEKDIVRKFIQKNNIKLN